MGESDALKHVGSEYSTYYSTKSPRTSTEVRLERDADDRDEHGDIEAGDDADNGANEAEDGNSEATSNTANNVEEEAQEAAEKVAGDDTSALSKVERRKTMLTRR